MADNVYNLKFTLSNGDVIDAGQITAPQGPKGDKGDISISGGGGSEYANTSEIVDFAITLTSTSTLDDLVTQILAQKTKVVRATWNSNFQRIIPLPTLSGPPDIYYYVYFKVWSDYTSARRIDCFATSGGAGSSSKWDYRGYICGAASKKYFSGWVSESNPYPVGAIYIAVATAGISVANNPANCFGGTWEYIEEGKFLLSATPPTTADPAGQAYPAGSTGGSADAVVVSHRHYVTQQNEGWNISTTTGLGGTETVEHSVTLKDTSYDEQSNATVSPLKTTTDGESGTGKNMPPYLAVCMWKRVD